MYYITRKCTTLCSQPDQVHMQNMEQLYACDCHQNVTEPQATESHIKYTHVYTLELWVRPGYNIQACCTQAGPAQAAGHGDGMHRWQHSNHLLLHALPITSIAWSGVQWPTQALHESSLAWPVWLHETTMSQATKTNRIDRLPCSYVIALATE